MRMKIDDLAQGREHECVLLAATPGEKWLAVRRRKDAVVLIWIGGEWM